MIEILKKADVIIITAGAGMGVDSGLATFRGDAGFWNAYPALGNKKMNFMSIANPKAFNFNPSLAWAFYGHRFDTYKNTIPHNGFNKLLDFCKSKKDYFVVTSNVDGHFQKAGFDDDKVYEVHGRINKFQCTHCYTTPWKADDNLKFDIDPKAKDLKSEVIPTCPNCGATARPNIMMFGDYGFNAVETNAQEKRFNTFMHKYDKNDTIAIIEIGAGTAIPTIRMIGENIHNVVAKANLIRINPDESFGPQGTISISKGALDGINEILED